MLAFVISTAGMVVGGAAVARRLWPGLTVGEAIGIGLVVGLAAVTWALQVLFAVGVPPGGTSWMLAGVAALGVFAVLFRVALFTSAGRGQIAEAIRAWRPSLSGTLLATALAIFAALALAWPVVIWDAQAIWVSKGRGLLVAGALDGILAGRWPHYPIGLPIVHAGALSLGGEAASKLVAPLYLGALGAVVAGSVSRAGKRWVGSLAALAAITTPMMLGYTLVAYADVPFAAAATISNVYLLEFARRRQSSTLWLVALTAAATAMLRLEAPALAAIQILIILTLAHGRTRLIAPIGYLAVYASASAPWQVISRTVISVGDVDSLRAAVLPTDLLTGSIEFDRLRQIGAFFGSTIVSPTAWSLAFALMLVGIAILLVHHRGLGFTALAIVLLNSLVMFAVFYSVPSSAERLYDRWLVTAFDRLLLHWVPIGAVAAGLALQCLLRDTPRPLDSARSEPARAGRSIDG